MRLSLPLPPRELNPNTATHWAKKAKVKAQCRADAYFLCRSESHLGIEAGVQELPLTVEFRLPGKRKRDADNLLASAKAALDGVSSALEIDDSRFNPITVVRAYGAPQPGEMVVCIG